MLKMQLKMKILIADQAKFAILLNGELIGSVSFFKITSVMCRVVSFASVAHHSLRIFLVLLSGW